MTQFTKRSLYVFTLPLIGFWVLLLTVYLSGDFEGFKMIPTLLYFISSGYIVFKIQSLITGSEYDPIIKNSKTRGLLICLLISTLSVIIEFYFEESKSLLPSIIIVFSTLASLFLTGLFDYSNEQLEERFLERSSERNFSIESRESWGLYLDVLENQFVDSSKVKKEINRIRNLLPYSSFFRSEKSKTILEQLEEIKNVDNLVSTLKKYVK